MLSLIFIAVAVKVWMESTSYWPLLSRDSCCCNLVVTF